MGVSEEGGHWREVCCSGLHKQVLRIADALHNRCGIAAGALALDLHSYLYVTRTPVAAVTAGFLSFVYFNKRNEMK